MLYNATLLAYLRIKGRAKRSSVLANTAYPAAEFDAWRNLGKLGLDLAHVVHAAHPLQVLLTSLAVQAVCAPICTTRSMRNLDELAAQFKLTRFHFAKTYCALTGHAPVQEFIQLKMAHACRLLDEGEQSICRWLNSWATRMCITSCDCCAKWSAWHPVITGRCIRGEAEVCRGRRELSAKSRH